MAPLDAIKETLEVHQSQLLEKDKALHQQHLEIKKMERACSGSDLSDFAQEHVVLKQPKSVVCGRFFLLQIQWGSEYWTSLVFKSSPIVEWSVI